MKAYELSDYMDEITTFLREKDFNGLDLWIKDDMYNEEPIFLLAFLRLSFPFRKRLSMYEPIKAQLSEIYKDNELRGL